MAKLADIFPKPNNNVTAITTYQRLAASPLTKLGGVWSEDGSPQSAGKTGGTTSGSSQTAATNQGRGAHQENPTLEA